MRVAYCSRECQVSDWKVSHKQKCYTPYETSDMSKPVVEFAAWSQEAAHIANQLGEKYPHSCVQSQACEHGDRRGAWKLIFSESVRKGQCVLVEEPLVYSRMKGKADRFYKYLTFADGYLAAQCLKKGLTLDVLHQQYQLAIYPISAEDSSNPALMADYQKLAAMFGVSYGDVGSLVATCKAYMFVQHDRLGTEKVANALYATGSMSNHSCNPNSVVVVGADGRLYMYALQDIARGDELTHDYKIKTFLMPSSTRDAGLKDALRGATCSCDICTGVTPAPFEHVPEVQNMLDQLPAVHKSKFLASYGSFENLRQRMMMNAQLSQQETIVCMTAAITCYQIVQKFDIQHPTIFLVLGSQLCQLFVSIYTVHWQNLDSPMIDTVLNVMKHYLTKLRQGGNNPKLLPAHQAEFQLQAFGIWTSLNLLAGKSDEQTRDIAAARHTSFLAAVRELKLVDWIAHQALSHVTASRSPQSMVQELLVFSEAKAQDTQSFEQFCMEYQMSGL